MLNVTVTDGLEMEDPFASVAEATQEIDSLGDTKLDVSCQVAPVFVAPFVAVQAYVTAKEPSFASVAVAEHVSKLDVVKPLFGVINAAVIVGTVLITWIVVD